MQEHQQVPLPAPVALTKTQALERRQARNALLRDAIENNGSDALDNIQPISFQATLAEGVDLENTKHLLEPCIWFTPCVNPLFDAAITKLGGVRRGPRGYSFSVGEAANPENLRQILHTLPPRVCYTPDRARKQERSGGHPNVSNIVFEIAWMIRTQTSCGEKLGYQLNTALGQFPYHQAPIPALSHSSIVVSTNQKELFITVATVKDPESGGFYLAPDTPNLDLLRYSGIHQPVLVTPDEAVTMIGCATEQGYTHIREPAEFDGLRDTLAESVIAQMVPGSPGKSRIILGSRAAESHVDLDEYQEVLTPLYEHCDYATSATVTASVAGRILLGAKSARLRAFHPHVQDVMNMEQCDAVKIPKLYDYQNQAVALHLTSNIGYLNACSPGLGKTIMALAACEHKAAQARKAGNSYRAVVACPAAITTQWARECAIFFPSATVFSLTTKNIKQLQAILKGETPVSSALIIIGGYPAIQKALPLLVAERFDEVICDEAAILKSTTSARARALWQLRKRARVAVALTGTPIEKSIDDLGQILSWVRADEHLFRGEKLSRAFDLTDPEQLGALWETLGPTVFRRDRSEIADQLPVINTEVVTLDGHASEIALANGARDRLQQIYNKMIEQIEAAQTLHSASDDEETLAALAQARGELASSRGAVLGGVTLARMAASDPSAVANSDSEGAALLDSEGLIDAAVKHGGTKRKYIVEMSRELVENDEAVIIFTDFSSVAESLVSDLEKSKVRVGKFLGGMKQSARDASVTGFQGTPCTAHTGVVPGAARDCEACTQPSLDVLVLTGAGREGLNLQRTTVLVHYDLPWVPSQVVQRVGRASRFGATTEQLQIIIPLMKDTIEERIASVLIPRAMLAMQVMDGHRNVDLTSSEMSTGMGELAQAIHIAKDAPEHSVFQLARELVVSS